jgi:hypothetical protein
MVEKHKHAPPGKREDESGSEDAGSDADVSQALGADSKLVPNAGTKSKQSNGSDAKSVEETQSLRPILPFLEGAENRPPAEVLAWMIAPMSLQQFFEYHFMLFCSSLDPFSEFWEKKPLLLKRHKRNYYKHLFSSDALDAILREVSDCLFYVTCHSS